MINTAIIGCGMSARTFHLPLIAANPAYCLTALVSSREQPDLAIPRYADAGTMLAESNAELVIITAPNSVHYDLAAECLAAGRHVVLEKPMVNTFAEGQALIRLAAENRRLLSVFHNRRWDSDYLTLRQLLTDGVLGAPRLLISRWDRYRPQVRDRWRENPGAGAGVWYDLGAHLLDQTLDLFGLPQAVTGHCRACVPVARPWITPTSSCTTPRTKSFCIPPLTATRRSPAFISKVNVPPTSNTALTRKKPNSKRACTLLILLTA